MNYKKIYENFCEYCKTTTPKERLEKRNKSDYRLQNDYLYTEYHHIIPKHSGGNNHSENLVELLPEEHYLVHLIRYKGYNNRNDFLSIRFMINGFIKHRRYENNIDKKLLNKQIGWFRQEIQHFRKNHEWHTKSGLDKISKANKNKMPVKDVKTDKIIGSVSVNHEKVKSGEWIHHTSGYISVIDNDGNKKRVTSKEYQSNKNLYKANIGKVDGKNNPRYSGYTDEDIINLYIEFIDKLKLDFIIPYPSFILAYKEKYNYNLPKSLSSFRFMGKGKIGLYEIIKEKTNKDINIFWCNNKKISSNVKTTIKNFINDKD